MKKAGDYGKVKTTKNRNEEDIQEAYQMKNVFSKGEAIANGLDPNRVGFMCGSINAVDPDGYWIALLGTGRGMIYREEAVSLKDVLFQNRSILIAADRRRWYDDKCFVGGVVAKNDEAGRQYVINVSGGTGYMPHSNAILVERIIAELEAKGS